MQKCNMQHANPLIHFIRETFRSTDFIPLHTPYFGGNEKKYLMECIDSTFLSSVGTFVNRFEEEIASYTGAGYAVACVNGTNALYIALLVGGVQTNHEVLTQALTFVATANAISYSGAHPVFVDVEKESMGMCPKALGSFLEAHAEKKSDGFAYNRQTGRKIKACIPMHTFGLPMQIKEIAAICKTWNIVLIEDAAESLGSTFQEKSTGTFGELGVFSFNGNKTITCGGGGAIVTSNEKYAQQAKHLTTQAKVPHRWKFNHDTVGYNYRMPNLNAAVACAQLEMLPEILANKRELAGKYESFFKNSPFSFIKEPKETSANYWLNAIELANAEERDAFLAYTNDKGIMTRPIWELMTSLPMFAYCQHDGLVNSGYLAERIVNIPSSYRPL